MKALKVLFISTLFLTGLSATADTGCLKSLKKSIVTNVGMSAAAFASVFGAPVGVTAALHAHQARKMYGLLKESVFRKNGKRTKSMSKSLNGIWSFAKIQSEIRKLNKKGVMCNISEAEMDLGHIYINRGYTLSYYYVKEQFRIKIDMELVKNGKLPIWNDIKS